MARSLLLALPLFACALSALVSCDDSVALHQRAIHVRALEEAQSEKPNATRVKPTEEMVARVRPELRAVANGLILRAKAVRKLPIPVLYRWHLVGKISQWALQQYKMPRKMEDLELLDGLIDLSSEVLSRPDIETMDDEVLNAELRNITRLQKLAHRYAARVEAPKIVVKMVDALAASAREEGAMDGGMASQILVDVVNETAGPGVAELVSYAKARMEAGHHADRAKLCELYLPIFHQLGAPAAVIDYVFETIHLLKNHSLMDPTVEDARAQQMLALSARQLNLPSFVPEALDWCASLAGVNVSGLPAPEQRKLLGKLSGLCAEANDELGGPEALSTLLQHFGPNSAEKATPAVVLKLLGQTSEELSLPLPVSEFFSYMASAQQPGKGPEEEHLEELALRLSSALARNGSVVSLSREASRRKPWQKPQKLDTAHAVAKMAADVMRDFGMPKLADAFQQISSDCIRDKSVEHLPVMLAFSFPKVVLPELEHGAGLVGGVNQKLLAPLLPFYEQAVDRFTREMPESMLKAGLRFALGAKTSAPAS